MTEFRKQFRREIRSLGEMDKRLSALDETFDGIMRDLANTLQTENLTDCEFSIGSTIRQFGPFIYGYSISMDAKGNPSVREFGNVNLSKDPQDAEPSLIYSQEQLVDIINEPKQVRILAELPGVDKSVIKTTVAKDSVTIRVISSSQKYHRRLQLPTDVNPKTLKTRYVNGCLEITLRKLRLENPLHVKAPMNRRIPSNHSSWQGY